MNNYCFPNEDLSLSDTNKAIWSLGPNRRKSLHNLWNTARYGLIFRAGTTLQLQEAPDDTIAARNDIASLTSLDLFSAMIVVRADRILYEKYAPDFGVDQLHSIQSITKMTINLIIGRLEEEGAIKLDDRIGDYIPEIGAGYVDATIQEVLDMNVTNAYSEDFSDPTATYFAHEEAMGWRLPVEPTCELTQRSFLSQIGKGESVTRPSFAQYKDANSDVLAWVAERASGTPLRSMLAEIVDAAGLEHVLYVSTDRDGFPNFDGGACLSARDLARFLMLFIRGGAGVHGGTVGSSAFIKRSRERGVSMPPPHDWVRYSNHVMVWGRAIGHTGWAGQCAFVDEATNTIGVFFGVSEDEHGLAPGLMAPVIEVFASIAGVDLPKRTADDGVKYNKRTRT